MHQRVLAVALVGALALAGCSGSDEPAAESDTSADDVQPDEVQPDDDQGDDDPDDGADTDEPSGDDAEAGDDDAVDGDGDVDGDAGDDDADAADDTGDDGEEDTDEPGDPDPVDSATPATLPETVPTEPEPEPDAGPLPVPEVVLFPAGNFDAPVDLAWRFVDPRLFVVEKNGRIVAADAESSVTVFDIADVDGVGLSLANEQGLLGLAFHPDDDLAYVNFTDAGGDTVIAEFAIDPATAEFDPATFREVLTIDQPFSNHNGGDLEFGPDGYLYIGTGDGGSGGDPERTALDLTSRLGKLLRIDPRQGDDGAPFTVPDDNPFLGADDADPTIWAYGLRNPWKFSFDPDTNDLWIGDVGQNEFEEIHLAPAVDGADAGRGVSFGWSAFEGDARFNEDQPAEGHLPPVVTYSHSNGGCSVSAGEVARDSFHPDLNGWYVYGDFCSGQVWALDTTSVGVSDSTVVGEPIVVEITNVPQLVGIRTGPEGDLYTISIAGEVARLAQG